MIKTVIHQPDFLPWLGYFDKISQADQFIILDDVQFSRRGWTHRDKILSKNKKKWLTVPIKKASFDEKINKIEISYEVNWVNNHYNILKEAYAYEKNFNIIIDEIIKIYNNKFKLLIDLNYQLILFILSKLDIKTIILFSSSFNINSKKSDKILDLLTSSNSNYYITGKPSEQYLNLNKFKEKNIFIKWHNLSNGIFAKKKNINTDVSIIDYIMKND